MCEVLNKATRRNKKGKWGEVAQTSNRSPIISAGLFVASQTESVTQMHRARRQELFVSRLNVFTPPSFMHEREPDGKQTQTEGSNGSKEREKFGLIQKTERGEELRCKGRREAADGFFFFFFLVRVSGWAITAGVTAQLQVGQVCV